MDRKIIEIEYVKSYNVTLTPRRGGFEEVGKHKRVTTNRFWIAFPYKFPGLMVDNFVRTRHSAMRKQRDDWVHCDDEDVVAGMFCMVVSCVTRLSQPQA